MERSVPSGIPVIKSYDIRLHTLASNYCEELSSIFEQRSRKSLTGMMDVYDKSVQYV